VCLGSLGCGDPPPIPESEETPESAAARPGAPAAARYLTTYAFVSAGGDASFYAAFTNEADATNLGRHYTAWVARQGSWTRLLTVNDTLPVPRAGWRVLPSDSMRILIGEDARILDLEFLKGDGSTRLRLGDEIAAWTGATGQRQVLALAGLESDGSMVPGFAFFRRAARPLSVPPTPGTDRIFMLADTLGNGLLIEAPARPEDPAVAHTWLHGAPSNWSDVGLEPVFEDSGQVSPASDSTRIPTEWQFVIRQADLRGELRIAPGEDWRASGPVSSRLAHRIIGELIADGESFLFEGLTVELPLP
jgi:hypothetical protein